MYRSKHKITQHTGKLNNLPRTLKWCNVKECLCVGNGTDQCNINVSISTKLSSSSRENRAAAPVSMTLGYMIPALNSPSSLGDNICIEFRLKCSSRRKVSMNCELGVYISPRIQHNSYEYYITAPSQHATTASLTDQNNQIFAFLYQCLYLIMWGI